MFISHLNYIYYTNILIKIKHIVLLLIVIHTIAYYINTDKTKHILDSLENAPWFGDMSSLMVSDGNGY